MLTLIYGMQIKYVVYIKRIVCKLVLSKSLSVDWVCLAYDRNSEHGMDLAIIFCKTRVLCFGFGWIDGWMAR
jgi:hypothetical protein